MKKEDYVSLEVAKLLKEKGYDEYCGAYYHLNWEDMTEEECFEVAPNKDFKNKDNGYRVGAPTLYEAQKWLRKKGLVVEVGYMYGDYYIYDILKIPTHDLIGLNEREPIKYCSYEEALNAGILEALKLYKITREDIKRAAEQNISSYSEIDFAELLANLGRECFCYGAEWRINSVWHTDLKEAQPQREFIVEFTNGRRGMFDDIRVLKGMEGLVRRYAYVDDLMPDALIAELKKGGKDD